MARQPAHLVCRWSACCFASMSGYSCSSIYRLCSYIVYVSIYVFTDTDPTFPLYVYSHPPVLRTARLFVCSFIVSVCSSVHLFASVRLSVRPSVRLSVCPSLYPSVCPSDVSICSPAMATGPTPSAAAAPPQLRCSQPLCPHYAWNNYLPKVFGIIEYNEWVQEVPTSIDGWRSEASAQVRRAREGGRTALPAPAAPPAPAAARLLPPSLRQRRPAIINRLGRPPPCHWDEIVDGRTDERTDGWAEDGWTGPDS